ncbi:alcohol dehydrogenase catalytic domain-containing protein, partial [Paenibacillus larvae]|uniref:alcohol dehydrogenase catalytic domain-containing protein n=1 Tax=Paenibacillus larvae TaxID=1464 RepID=UPI003D286CD6
MEFFHALVAYKEGENVKLSLKKLGQEDLPEGEILIRVDYSSVNYKDGLASSANGRVVSRYPIVPGIDLAGTVLSSKDSRFHPGDEVIATSYDIGTGRYGGYSEIACIPADYVVPLPKGLTMREAMILGTAGFTAALSVQRLEDNGLHPGQGPVAVAGATGGVGSHAVSMLAGIGYEVHASTG